MHIKNSNEIVWVTLGASFDASEFGTIALIFTRSDTFQYPPKYSGQFWLHHQAFFVFHELLIRREAEP